MNPFVPTLVTLPLDVEPPCVGRWELFDSTDQADHAKAAALCNECPIRKTCEQIALNQRDTATGKLGVEGTWAGSLYGEERNVVRRAKRAADKPCGTRAAFRRHMRAGEEPCEPCRLADNEWQREWREKKAAKDAA